MDDDTRAFVIRFTKSAALLALGAAAHVWLLPSTRHTIASDELVAVAHPPGFSPQPQPHGSSVIALIESTSDDLAGPLPQSPLPPTPTPAAGSSSRVIVAVETVAANQILDRLQDDLSLGQRLASEAMSGTPGATGTSGTVEAPGIVGAEGTFGAERSAGTERSAAAARTTVASRAPGSTDAPPTAELQLASEALTPPRRPAHDEVALARPVSTSDTPHIAVNARQLMEDEQMVRRVLQQYRVAYEQLDAAAAKSVWPSVDERALTHAFQQLASQRVTFRSCGISITGAGANARCRGEAEYLPKIGAKRAYTTSGEWVFDLAREQTSWRIVNATVQ